MSDRPEVGRVYRIWLGSGFFRYGKVVKRDQDGKMVYVEWVDYPDFGGDWVAADDCN